MSGERNRAIVAAYEGGRTMQHIADEHGITRERVRQILFRARVKIRPSSPEFWPAESRERWRKKLRENGKKRAGKIGPQQARAVEMVRRGSTFSEAAKACGLTRNAVAGACHRQRVKAGVETKSA